MFKYPHLRVPGITAPAGYSSIDTFVNLILDAYPRSTSEFPISRKMTVAFHRRNEDVNRCVAAKDLRIFLGDVDKFVLSSILESRGLFLPPWQL